MSPKRLQNDGGEPQGRPDEPSQALQLAESLAERVLGLRWGKTSLRDLTIIVTAVFAACCALGIPVHKAIPAVAALAGIAAAPPPEPTWTTVPGDDSTPFDPLHASSHH